jgi:hypothetical protein
MFNHPRKSKPTAQTPGKLKADQISRDESMKGSKKSRNTNQTEKKSKNGSRN